MKVVTFLLVSSPEHPGNLVTSYFLNGGVAEYMKPCTRGKGGLFGVFLVGFLDFSVDSIHSEFLLSVKVVN